MRHNNIFILSLVLFALSISVPVRGRTPHLDDFSADFIVLYADKNPELNVKTFSAYRHLSSCWKANNLPADKKIAMMSKKESTGGDGIDEKMFDNKSNSLTFDLFYAADNYSIAPVSSKKEGDIVFYEYEENPLFSFFSELDTRRQTITFTLVPKISGYFSVGYLGAPESDFSDVDEIWQPQVWQQKHFPEQSFLTQAFLCPLPCTMYSKDGVTVGVSVLSEDIPYEPILTRSNSPFGVAIRNKKDKVQPMVFAPVLGGINSRMSEGEEFSFRIKRLVSNKSVPETYRDIAENEFGFEDYRSNALGSLNTTLENILDYAMSSYSCFLDSLKGCSYSTDVPGSVKNVSSIHPLELSIVADREELFTQRALPIWEFMLSRDQSLFCLDPEMKIQSPSRKMGGPAATVTEMMTINKISRGSMPYLDSLVSLKSSESWRASIVAYQTSGDKVYLNQAIEYADKYIQENVDSGISPDVTGFFYTSWVADFMSLCEMYDLTGEQKYADAARKSAYYYSMFIWMCPKIPDEHITVNKDGLVNMYWYLASKGHHQMYLPEEVIPAWRASEIGLHPESSTTCIGHRGIFMAHYAPFMLRIANGTDDDYLRNIGRSAVIGRYLNFPGYHMNTVRTTVYEKADYPLRKHKDLSYNSFHYNHILPMASMLLDYLVSDVYDRSSCAISFPHILCEGYAYLVSNVYGHEPGVFYDYDNVSLWMPKGLVKADSPEINYITGYDGENLFVAMTNQAKSGLHTTVSLSKELLPRITEGDFICELWQDNKKKGDVKLSDGKVTLTVSPKGITAIVVKGICPKPRFQNRILDYKEKKWTKGYSNVKDINAKAMIIDVGTGLKNVYAFFLDDESVVSGVRMIYYDEKGIRQELADNYYPYEFSVPIPDEIDKFSFDLVVLGKDGKEKIVKDIVLAR